MGRVINRQMTVRIQTHGSDPELKFLTLNQACLCPAFLFSCAEKQVDEDTPDSRGAAFLAGLQPSGTGLSEGWPSFLVHCCHSGASDQRPGPELSDRKGCSSHFFLSSLSAQDWFQKGSVKTIVTKRRIFPSSSWVRPSKKVENGGPW